MLLDKLAESVVVISGAPNVGKSSLAVHLAKTLGLTRTKTRSQNFWLFARHKRPYFSLWVYCTDSFWSEDEPTWPRMRQSISSVTSNEEFQTGAVILEGHQSGRQQYTLPAPEHTVQCTANSFRLVVLVAQLVSRHSCVADRLPVAVRFPAGPRVRLKTVDPPKGNGLGQKKRQIHFVLN